MTKCFLSKLSTYVIRKTENLKATVQKEKDRRSKTSELQPGKKIHFGFRLKNILSMNIKFLPIIVFGRFSLTKAKFILGTASGLLTFQRHIDFIPFNLLLF